MKKKNNKLNYKNSSSKSCYKGENYIYNIKKFYQSNLEKLINFSIPQNQVIQAYSSEDDSSQLLTKKLN